MQCRLALVAEGFLKRNWLIAEGGSDKGPKFNQGVESILKVATQLQIISSLPNLSKQIPSIKSNAVQQDFDTLR